MSVFEARVIWTDPQIGQRSRGTKSPAARRRRQLRITFPPLANAGTVAITPESPFGDDSRGRGGRRTMWRSGLPSTASPSGRPTRAAAGWKRRPHRPATCGTASPVPPRRPGHRPTCGPTRVGRPHRSGPETEGVEVVQGPARLSSRQLACPRGGWNPAIGGTPPPLAPFAATGAAEGVLARVGPTHRRTVSSQRPA